MSCDNTKRPTREARHNKLYNNKRRINSKFTMFSCLNKKRRMAEIKRGNCCVVGGGCWDSDDKILNNLGFSGMLGYV
jgi:hypothetical protein